ncbi:Rv3235 family protein [Isoptericola jiangsuensis]|uniref:Rv3235 family protein n=1 Tax=Isoptericola jiangsuensis TaxID=548579 RepID=UPI003AADCFB6
MTTTAPEPAQTGDQRTGTPRPASDRPLRVSAPMTRRPGEPPRATRRPGPVRRVRIGAARPLPRPVAGRDEPPVEPTTSRPAPGDPTAMCCSVVRAALEVLRGERSATQVARWVTPAVLEQLLQRARLVRDARSATTTARTSRPVAVRRVRMVRLTPATAEATVVLDDDGRVRAAAVRLEVHRGAWRVAVLEIG